MPLIHHVKASCSPSSIQVNESSPVMHVNHTNASGNPELVLVIKPVSKMRFRYQTEKGSHGVLTGYMDPSVKRAKKVYPVVQLKNYVGKKAVYMKISLYTLDEKMPHVLYLYGKDCKDGVCRVKFGKDLSATFQVSIGSRKKEEVLEVLKQRYQQNDSYENDFETESVDIEEEAKNFNQNAAKLCFEAYVEGDPHRPICRTFSDAIYNSKSSETGDLKICRLSKVSGSCSGGDEVFLFCDKVKKENVKVRFYEEKEGEVVWEDYGTFNKADWHHQVALVFKTPAYRENEETKVWIELLRTTDGAASVPREFHYIPNEIDLPRKRRRLDPPSDELSSFDVNKLGSLERMMFTAAENLGFPVTSMSTEDQLILNNDVNLNPGIFHEKSLEYISSSSDAESLSCSFDYDIGEFNFAWLDQPTMNFDFNLMDDGQMVADTVTKERIEGQMGTDSVVFAVKEKGLRPAVTKKLAEGQMATDSVTKERIEGQMGTDSVVFAVKEKGLRPAVTKKLAEGQMATEAVVIAEGQIATDARVIAEAQMAPADDLTQTFSSLRLTSEPALCQNVTELRNVKSLPKSFKLNIKEAVRDAFSNGNINSLLRCSFQSMPMQDRNGDTFLHLAAIHQAENFDFISKLLELAPDYIFNHQNKRKKTALHVATETNKQLLITLLLSRGASPVVQDAVGDTCIHIACKRKYDKVLKELLSRIEDPNELSISNHEGLTPAHICVIQGAQECLQLLAKYKADLNVIDKKSGRTPLHFAVEAPLPILKFLLSQPTVDKNAEDFSGRTVLNYAEDNGSKEIKLLIEDASASSCEDDKEFNSNPPKCLEIPSTHPEILKGNSSCYSSGAVTEFFLKPTQVQRVCNLLDPPQSGWETFAMMLEIHADSIKNLNPESPTKALLKHFQSSYKENPLETLKTMLEMAELSEAAATLEELC